MSDSAVLTDRVDYSLVDENSSPARLPVRVSILILMLGMGVSAWMYFSQTHALSSLAQETSPGVSQRDLGAQVALLRQFDRWVLWSVIGTIGCGTGLLLAMVRDFVKWRRAWLARVQTWKEEAQKQAVWLESQLADSRKSELQLQGLRTEAQKHVAALESSNAQLQSELDKLKRAGKTLTQQQQVLESSRAVLELHVQARTKELQKLRRRYELILNSAGEGICGLNEEGKLTFANPAAAKLTGWPLEELIGKTEQEIFGQRSAGNAAVATDHTSEELVFGRSDGTSFKVECVRTPIEENGSVVGSVLVFKDITERKRVEEALAQQAAELARSNTELEQFAFVASHDLQEPLRKIQAFGDRLKSKCDGTLASDARDYLERMQGASARMRRLIDDLLAFSRVMRSAEPFVPVNLSAATKEVLSDLEVRIEKSGARVEVGDLPVIEADPMQVRQLLLNLISNGLKFQPPGAAPLVKVHARVLPRESVADTGFVKKLPVGGEPGGAADQLCEISVQDNGIGFDEKYTEKIFAVFQRLHGRNEYEGTGVGLAVCRRITERHHGSIVAHSKPGQGATFVVTLPVQRPKAPVLP